MTNDEKRIYVFHKSYKINQESGCWEWQKSKSGAGYGQIRFRGVPFSAHRMSYVIHKGEIPDGMYILHSCDNRSCVNPDHLSVGTCKENLHEMFSKGRHNRWSHGKGLNSLTEDQVIEIKRSSDTDRITAEKYGVSMVHVANIRRGVAWKNVAPELNRDVTNPRPYESVIQDPTTNSLFFYQIRHFYLMGDIDLV